MAQVRDGSVLTVAGASNPVVPPVVLVIDAGRIANDQFVAGLASEGFRPLLSGTGEEGLALAANAEPDIVVVGAGLPDLSSFAVIRLFRELGRGPVIAMSFDDDENEAVLALETGAVDFLNHPGRVRECAARLWLALRGSPGGGPSSSVTERVMPEGLVAAGPVEVDLRRREVRVRGVPLHARPKEIELLGLLVSEAGYVVTRERAIGAIWPDGGAEKSKTLDVHVRRIRALVEADPSRPRHVITIRGYGHRFDP